MPSVDYPADQGAGDQEAINSEKQTDRPSLQPRRLDKNRHSLVA